MTQEIFILSKAKNKPIKIIDLSADYRLSVENYEANYCVHTDKENLTNAIYGLVEYNRQSIQNATLWQIRAVILPLRFWDYCLL